MVALARRTAAAACFGIFANLRTHSEEGKQIRRLHRNGHVQCVHMCLCCGGCESSCQLHASASVPTYKRIARVSIFILLHLLFKNTKATLKRAYSVFCDMFSCANVLIYVFVRWLCESAAAACVIHTSVS